MALAAPQHPGTRLKAEGCTSWLEIGGKGVEQRFFCIRIGDPESVPERFRDRCQKLGTLSEDAPLEEHETRYDLIRMQHVFEHFGPEDGRDMLRAYRRMPTPVGYLPMTTPDLAILAQVYRKRRRWAFPRVLRYRQLRIPADAPSRYTLSMIARQYGDSRLDHLGEQRCRCDVFKGLAHKVRSVGGFDRVRRLGLLHRLASHPFTHTRMGQEVCLLARKA
jgi:hypothetical protein